MCAGYQQMSFFLPTTIVIVFRYVNSSYWLHCTKYFSRNSMYKKLNKVVQGAPCGSFFKARVRSTGRDGWGRVLGEHDIGH